MFMKRLARRDRQIHFGLQMWHAASKRFAITALEQYGRRENLRIYGVPETNNNNDDGEDVVLRIAKFLQIDLQGMDIQRAHRLGKKNQKT